jgi:hypothetical protein
MIGIVVALSAVPPTQGLSGNTSSNSHPIDVDNSCSRAAQVGWVAVDPLVPLSPDAAEHFFADAFYVADSEWPYVDEYSTYSYQSTVIEPGKTGRLDMGPPDMRRDRLLIVRSFSPKSGRSPGTVADGRVEVFELGEATPNRVGIVDGTDACVPLAPLDRRYRF